MNSVLKLFAIETLLEFVGQYLAGTIKNRDSAKAQKILGAVRKLDRVIGAFLQRFDTEFTPRFPFQE